MAQSASNVSLHKVLRMDMVILWTWKTAGHLLVTTAMYSSMERIANAAMLKKIEWKEGSVWICLPSVVGHHLFCVYVHVFQMSKKLDECQLCGLPIGFLRCIPSGQLLPGTIHLFGTEYGEPRRSWNVRNVSSIIGELHGKYDYICWKGRQLGESTTLKVKPGNSRTVYFSTSHQRLLRKMQTATLIYIGGIGIIPVSKALILERFYILQQL